MTLDQWMLYCNKIELLRKQCCDKL